VASVGEVTNFMLQQMEHVSKNEFRPEATRHIPEDLWLRAHSISSLFGTDQIRPCTRLRRTFYCCQPRDDHKDKNVCNRGAISDREAGKLTDAFVAQLAGGATTIPELQSFNGPRGRRIFGYHNDIAFCTCPSFPSARMCFHTIGLALFLGKEKLPDSVDPTLLSSVSRGGAKRKAPGRGAVLLMSDEKDLRIAQLEAQIRKMRRANSHVVVADRPWEPTRRCRGKTSQPEAVAAIRTPSDRGTAAPSTPQLPASWSFHGME